MTINYDVRVNGTWLSTIGAVLHERRLPVLPEAEENTMKLAGTDGALDFGSTYQSRRIELTLDITSPASEFHRTLSKLARIFEGARRDITLEFSDIKGRIYHAVNNGTLALDGQVGSRLVSVSLKAHDPWPESDENVTETVITRSPEAVNIESAGDVSTKSTLILVNTGTNTIRRFTITNEYII